MTDRMRGCCAATIFVTRALQTLTKPSPNQTNALARALQTLTKQTLCNSELLQDWARATRRGKEVSRDGAHAEVTRECKQRLACAHRHGVLNNRAVPRRRQHYHSRIIVAEPLERLGAGRNGELRGLHLLVDEC